MKYSVVIHKDPNSDYGVTVPDLPGCFSAGSTLDDALENAKEAIECHLEGLLMEHETIPVLKHIEKHQSNPEYEAGVWALVDIDISQLSGKASGNDIRLKTIGITRLGQQLFGFLGVIFKQPGDIRAFFVHIL